MTHWRTLLMTVLLAFAVAAPAGAEPAYLGAKACKKCHLKQYKSWEKTKMADSFSMLKPGERADAKKAAKLDPAKDYTADAECLGCHVTGYGKPGGYDPGAPDEKLQALSCEMCHGPGGDFLADDRHSKDNKEFKSADLAKFGFVGKPAQAQCEACHNDKSPFFEGFDFEKSKEEGVHEHFKLKYEH